MVGRMISPSHACRRFLRLAGAAAAAAMSSRAFGAEQQNTSALASFPAGA